MGRGHGATRGGGLAKGGGGVYGKISAAERAIMNNDFETGILFDDNGNIISQKVGDEHSVEIDAKNTKNAIFTHNHPSGSSFSGDDLVSMVSADIKEMRIIGKEYTYSMKRPEGGWGKTAKEVRQATDFLRRNVTMARYEKMKTGNPQTDRKLWIQVTTETTAKIAAKFGWDFKVTAN